MGSIPGFGRCPGEGNGNPLQYSCLENPHGQKSLAGYKVTKSWMQLRSDLAGLEGMMEVLSEPQFKLLPAGHTWVPQLREKEVWPPQPLTQSSSTFTPEGTDRHTQLPRGKRRSREVEDLPEVTQSGAEGASAAVTTSACRWQQTERMALPLQRRWKRDVASVMARIQVRC